METICLIPIKNMQTVKSRLSSHFNHTNRRKIFMYMLEKTIKTLKTSEINECWLLSSDPEIETFAKSNNIALFKDCPNGLNETLTHYVKKVFDLGYNAMYLAPDLPLITPVSISKLMQTFENNTHSILVPDLTKTGINAILWKHNVSFGPFLGINSYQVHLAKAMTQNVRVSTYENKQLQYDLDTFDQFKNLPDCVKSELLSL